MDDEGRSNALREQLTGTPSTRIVCAAASNSTPAKAKRRVSLSMLLAPWPMPDGSFPVSRQA